MSANHHFPNLEKAAARLDGRGAGLTLPELRELLCFDCDFFHEDHEDELECSAFRMLRLMLERGTMTPGGLADMTGP